MFFDDLDICFEQLASMPERIAVAVSGGADSVALAHMLGAWRDAKAYSFTIHVLSVDHGFRSQSARESRDVCAFFTGREGYTANALRVEWGGEQPDSGVMQQARQKRYELMSEYCAVHNVPYLFLGHHRDDQAETFLMRLTRGSGLDGLTAMDRFTAYNDNLMLVRPLLARSHADLIEYCTDHNVHWVEDPTNEDDAYTRNRIRRSMDVLAAEGLTSESIMKTASRLSRASEALTIWAQNQANTAFIAGDRLQVKYRWDELSSAPYEIIMRIVLAAYDRLRPEKYYRPRMDRLEDLLDSLIAAPDEFKSRTLGGLEIKLLKGELIIRREK